MNGLTYCQKRYIEELQLSEDDPTSKERRKQLRTLSHNYSFNYCLDPSIFAFLITWQRVEQCITDPEHSDNDELIDTIRKLARKEIELSTGPIPRESILGAAICALGLEQECNTLTDLSVKE
jgi:hypothetical protein